jgi:hypothetical protein
MHLNRFYLDRRKIKQHTRRTVKKSKTGKTKKLQQNTLRQGQIYSGEVLRMDGELQKTNSQILKTSRNILEINPHSLHNDTIESIEIGSL